MDEIEVVLSDTGTIISRLLYGSPTEDAAWTPESLTRALDKIGVDKLIGYSFVPQLQKKIDDYIVHKGGRPVWEASSLQCDYLKEVVWTS